MHRVDAERRRRALQLNDDVLQNLITAKVAHDLGAHEQVGEAIEASLAAVRRIVHELLADVVAEPGPGDFVRTEPAQTGEPPAGS